MSKATMSILGLYNYDNDIFSDMVLPDGIDAEILSFEILRQCAELEIVYSDPAFMRGALKNWSLMNSNKWEKLYKTTVAEYDPIENYNRYESSKRLLLQTLKRYQL